MSIFLVVTLMADDRPGIVETLSKVVTTNHGNWLESRMARMAGKFAGIVHLQVAKDQQLGLTESLQALNKEDWKITVESSLLTSAEETNNIYQLSIVGNDRPGIVKEVSQVLSSLGVNVQELTTNCESAAMSAELLFKTAACIQVPNNVDSEELKDKLEAISNDLMVELSLESN